MDLEIIKIASNTENNNVLKNYTFATKYKSAMCGDELKIYLKVHKESSFYIDYFDKYLVYLSNNSFNYFTKDVISLKI